MNHYSTYDILSLTQKLQEYLGDVSSNEIQMFSYLSCLLSIYGGNTSGEWGYSFIKNEFDSPYSNEIEKSINSLIQMNSLNQQDEYFTLNEPSKQKYCLLKELGIYKEREIYLTASVKCIKFIPYSSVRKALFKEPTLSIARKHNDRQFLLDNNSASIHLLYEQFDLLRKVIDKDYKNLVIPALTWMTFQAQKNT